MRRRGQLASFFKGPEFEGVDLSFIKKFALKRMLLNKKISEPHFISYQIEFLPNRYVAKYSDIPILAWTVRTEESYQKALKYL